MNINVVFLVPAPGGRWRRLRPELVGIVSLFTCRLTGAGSMGKCLDAKNMGMNMATLATGTGGFHPVSAQVTSPVSLASLGNGQESDESLCQVIARSHFFFLLFLFLFLIFTYN